MKRFFVGKPTSSKPPSTVPSHDMATRLQPSFVLPPVPHPHPYEYIAISATDDGLVMRPHLPVPSHSLSYVYIPWGKHPKVQELKRSGNGDLASIDWTSSVIVYGIVGILDLFNGTET